MKKTITILAAILISKSLFGGNFKADTTKICTRTIVTFSENFGGIGWEWDFGDSSSKVYTNPASHPYKNPGVYTVTCKILYGDGTIEIVTKTNYITVLEGPKFTFTVDKKIICPGESINFSSTITSGGNAVKSYFWDFGDGNTSNSANPSHTYTSSGTRSVSLKVTDTIGCPNKIDSINYILIHPKPVVNFIASDSVFCVENNSATKQVTFTNQSDVSSTSFYWDFGDGTNSTQKNPPTKTYGAGFYNVKLEATNSYGCKDTIIKSNYIAVVVFEASFKASDTVLCEPGKTVIFTGTGYNANFYRWDFGNGYKGVGTVGVNTKYDKPGKYTVTTIATSRLGCSDTMVKQKAIWVYDKKLPNIEIHDTDHCNPNASIVCINHELGDSTDDLGLSHIVWDFGDNSVNGNKDSLTHNYGKYGSYALKALVTTSYGCVLPVYTQTIDIFKTSAFTYLIVPNTMIGEKPGGCLNHFVSVRADSVKSSSDIVDFIWDWGETEVWGSNAAPDTTHSGTYPIGSYTYNYDTGNYIINLIIINKQGCNDTIKSIAMIPIGYPPINDWYYVKNISCKSSQRIIVTAYDSINSINHNLVARSRANWWEWIDPKGNPMAFTNTTSLTPIDTGWQNAYCLIPYHNHCPGAKVCKDSIMYACPPMAGIAYPAPDLMGNPPVYCKFPSFGFDGGDGTKSKAWDSCVWRLGNYYRDEKGIFHPQTLILPDATHPNGHISPHQSVNYDTLGGMKMLVENKGHLFVTLWMMNDNRHGNNSCGYCEDSIKQEIIISVANMKLRATDENGNIISEICQDQAVKFYDSTYSTDGIYWWGLSITKNDSTNPIQYSTNDLAKKMNSTFTHPNYTKSYFDTTNYTGSNSFSYYFDKPGLYTIYLTDTSGVGCGMNNPLAPPFIEWQTSNWGPYIPYEGRQDSLQIIVNPRSIPKFSSNTPVCLGDSINFINESYTETPFSNLKINNFLWNIKGITDTSKNASYLLNNFGKYDVTLTVTNEKGCDSTIIFMNAITIMGVKTSFTTPNIPVNNRKACNKELITLKNTSSYFDLTRNVMVTVSPSILGMTYKWDFDGQGISNSLNGQFAFNVDSSRFVYITLTVTDMNGCSKTFTDSLYVIGTHAEFVSTTHELNCPPLNVLFNNQSYGFDSNHVVYQWLFGDKYSNQNISYQKNPTHSYSFAGNYDVKLIVIDEFNCSDTMIKSNYVKIGGPEGTFQIDTISGCNPLKVLFSFNIKNTDSLYFNYGDGNTDLNTFIGSPMKHVYNSANYFVPSMQLIKWSFDTLTGLYSKCAVNFTSKDTITVIDLIADFSIENSKQELLTDNIKVLYLNDSAYFIDKSVFNPTSISIRYNWNFGDGISNNSIVNNISHLYNDTGTYIVSLELQYKACKSQTKNHSLIVEYPDKITESNENLSIIIYPNPVQSDLYIKSEDINIKSIEIVDLLGKTIKQFQNCPKHINVSDLDKGVYFIRIKTNNNIINRKIIKI